jgi:hypothetical protein
MIRFFLLAFFFAALCAPHTAHAENMLSQFLRNIFDEPAGPQPHDTLKAPFPTDGATQTGSSSTLMKIYDERAAQTASTTASDKPHMTAHALREWVMQAVTNALTFDPQDTELAKKRASFFEPYAMTEFQNWMAASGINQSLGGAYTLRTVLSSDPTLLSEGTLNGTYRWVFDVPVIISYVPRGTTTLKTATTIPQSQKLTLRVQVGRVTDPNNQNILIERWATAP